METLYGFITEFLQGFYMEFHTKFLLGFFQQHLLELHFSWIFFIWKAIFTRTKKAFQSFKRWHIPLSSQGSYMAIKPSIIDLFEASKVAAALTKNPEVEG